MKFYSEELQKLFDTEKELKDAEKAFKDRQLVKETTKKELSQKIEDADKAVDDAYKNYEKAREYAAKLMDESNKEIIKIMEDAKAAIAKAEKARTDAIIAFNQQFGTYRANYSGERAKRESERVNRLIEDLFNSTGSLFF